MQTFSNGWAPGFRGPRVSVSPGIHGSPQVRITLGARHRRNPEPTVTRFPAHHGEKHDSRQSLEEGSGGRGRGVPRGGHAILMREVLVLTRLTFNDQSAEREEQHSSLSRPRCSASRMISPTGGSSTALRGTSWVKLVERPGRTHRTEATVGVLRNPGGAGSGGRASQPPRLAEVLQTFRGRASWPKRIGRSVRLQDRRSTWIEIRLRPRCVAACRTGTRNSCAAPSVRPSLATTAN